MKRSGDDPGAFVNTTGLIFSARVVFATDSERQWSTMEHVRLRLPFTWAFRVLKLRSDAVILVPSFFR